MYASFKLLSVFMAFAFKSVMLFFPATTVALRPMPLQHVFECTLHDTISVK